MTIEQRLAEIIQAFGADALSSAVNLNGDLDVVLCDAYERLGIDDLIVRLHPSTQRGLDQLARAMTIRGQ